MVLASFEPCVMHYKAMKGISLVKLNMAWLGFRQEFDRFAAKLFTLNEPSAADVGGRWLMAGS